jgi:hypothetical protein
MPSLGARIGVREGLFDPTVGVPESSLYRAKVPSDLLLCFFFYDPVHLECR